MGCDIHGFIEVKSKSAVWLPFAKLYLGRRYDVFARLAGVRGPADAAVVPPRGLPDDVSPQVSHECTLFILYHGQKPGDNTVGFADAADWVSQGRSRFFGTVRKVVVTINPPVLPETRIYNETTEGQPSHITNPDYHSFTWLSPEEFDQAIFAVSKISADYLAVSSAMKRLQEGAHDVRIILWFDN